MYGSLLVPLDRSYFGSRTGGFRFGMLGIARRPGGRASRLDLAEVHALYALEDRHAGRAPFEPERDAERKQQEQLYLDATATWLTSVSPVSVSTGVLNGSAVLSETVADSIIKRAQDGKADLVVMATHGYGLLHRFGAGSVADELIRRADVPVLLARRAETAPAIFPEPALDNILIPLDGSDLAEQVLGPALELARLMEARCTLLRVVEPRFASHHSAPKAAAYLEHVAARVREQRVSAEARVVFARDVAEAILAEAATQGSDLIAMATHARGGLARLFWGSVADRLVRAAASPVLVCPDGQRTSPRNAAVKGPSSEQVSNEGMCHAANHGQ